MPKTFNPDDKAVSYNTLFGGIQSEQTNADVVLPPLTAEVLRDIARNESCSKAWRKAAIKHLLKRKHPFVKHTDLILLVAELKEDQIAEQEVQDIVESVTEESL